MHRGSGRQRLEDDGVDGVRGVAAPKAAVELRSNQHGAYHVGIHLPRLDMHSLGLGHKHIELQRRKPTSATAQSAPGVPRVGLSRPEAMPVRRHAVLALLRAVERATVLLDVEGRVWADVAQRVADGLAAAGAVHAGDRRVVRQVLLTAFEPRALVKTSTSTGAAGGNGDDISWRSTPLVARRRALRRLEVAASRDSAGAMRVEGGREHAVDHGDDGICGWLLLEPSARVHEPAGARVVRGNTPVIKASSYGAAVVVGTVPELLRDTFAIVRVKRDMVGADGNPVRLLCVSLGSDHTASDRGVVARACAAAFLDDEFALQARTCVTARELLGGFIAVGNAAVRDCGPDLGTVVQCDTVPAKERADVALKVRLRNDETSTPTELMANAVQTVAHVSLGLVVPEVLSATTVPPTASNAVPVRRRANSIGSVAVEATALASFKASRAAFALRLQCAVCPDEKNIWSAMMDPGGRMGDELVAAYVAARANGEKQQTLGAKYLHAYDFAKKYSLFLLVGVVVAIIYANAANHNYEYWWGESGDAGQFTLSDTTIFGHSLSFNFLINDIFMCFFFGIATKEITVSCLPGGDLNPPRRAVNPIAATFGGVAGPSVMMFILIPLFYAAGAFGPNSLPLSELIKGWGIPTATDISLAWLVAVAVFGKGHPAVVFLLLLAVADDGIGLIIIAIFYGDPKHPAEPVYLLLVGGAVGIAWIMRRRHVNSWKVYCFVAGPIAWIGLALARIHPALALVPIVPLMPDKVFGRPRPRPPASLTTQVVSTANAAGAVHIAVREGGIAASAGSDKYGKLDEADEAVQPGRESKAEVPVNSRKTATPETPVPVRWADHDADSPLMAFSEANDGWVRVGMFFFALANAGTSFGGIGPLTWCVWIAIVVGKCAGVACVGWLCNKCGFPLPVGVSNKELLMMGLIASLGLTVALFVAGVAYTDHSLQVQSKMGAIFSASSGLAAMFIDRFVDYKGRWARVRAVLGIPDPDAPTGGRVLTFKFPGRDRPPPREVHRLASGELQELLAWRRRLAMFV